MESFDPPVLARVAPGKARTGIEGYFRTWERAVEVFGPGHVSTYVILGMGEDPDLTIAAASARWTSASTRSSCRCARSPAA